MLQYKRTSFSAFFFCNAVVTTINVQKYIVYSPQSQMKPDIVSKEAGNRRFERNNFLNVIWM
jgi:hypothetical protein